MKKLLLSIFVVFSSPVFAADWGGAKSPITKMYVYPSYAVIIQEDAPNYSGDANCRDTVAWSVVWTEFDEQTSQRIYSGLLAAYMSQKPLKPVFSSTACGPEGHKKFNGYFEM